MYLESGWMHLGFVELVFKLVGQQKYNWVGEILLGLFWAWLATALIQMVDDRFFIHISCFFHRPIRVVAHFPDWIPLFLFHEG